MGLSRTVSKINGDFSRKSQNFPTPVYFAPPLTGVPFGIVYRHTESKTRMMGLPDSQKSFKIGIAVWTQYLRVTYGLTDRHLTTAKTAL